MNVTQFLEEKGARTEQALDAYLSSWQDAPEVLIEVMRYSLFAGGKRLRPALALGAAELITGDDKPAIPAAMAVEMIHTYSLMHDDLPAMDNDDLRRGRPTAHIAFNEALAILGGDTLLTMAYDVLAQSGNIEAIRELAWAAGVDGMAAGQVLDLASENMTLTLEELQRVHACKTGALIRASVRLGAMLAGAAGPELEALSEYGEHVGLAFQIADDVLNVVGSESLLGKAVGSDAAHHKSTYPALLGLDKARELAEEARKQAVASLNGFGDEADTFRELARYVIERDR